VSLIHYQTLEPVNPDELQTLRAVKEEFNASRGFNERIKLWRKDDILDCLEPGEARWGFTQVRNEEEKLRVVSVMKRMSEATPRLTWVLYDEGDGGREVVLKAGKPLGQCPE